MASNPSWTSLRLSADGLAGVLTLGPGAGLQNDEVGGCSWGSPLPAV